MERRSISVATSVSKSFSPNPPLLSRTGSLDAAVVRNRTMPGTRVNVARSLLDRLTVVSCPASFEVLQEINKGAVYGKDRSFDRKHV
jgi:hypothetical protein